MDEENGNETAIESAESSQAARDLNNGIRARRTLAKCKAIAPQYGIDTTLVPAIMHDTLAGLRNPSLAVDAHALARKYGFEPQNLIDFINAILPIIMQFMAMCGA